jgi:ABC-2 type transport system permease protein
MSVFLDSIALNALTDNGKQGTEIKIPRPRKPNALSSAITMAWRSLMKLKHSPSQILDSTIFPILMILVMGTIFGGAIAGSIEEYLQHLIPGMLVLSVVMISQYTAFALNLDVTTGIHNRFRSLSFWRPASLVGPILGDIIRYTSTALSVMVVGAIMGFQAAAGLGGVLLAVAIVLVFSFAFSWIWTLLGLVVKNSESIGMISGIVSFPFLFLSNVFVNPVTMPDFLQDLTSMNPISLVANAVRGLMQGTANMGDIVNVLIASAVLVGIFFPLAMLVYNKKSK